MFFFMFNIDENSYVILTISLKIKILSPYNTLTSLAPQIIPHKLIQPSKLIFVAHCTWPKHVEKNGALNLKSCNAKHIQEGTASKR